MSTTYVTPTQIRLMVFMAETGGGLLGTDPIRVPPRSMESLRDKGLVIMVEKDGALEFAELTDDGWAYIRPFIKDGVL